MIDAIKTAGLVLVADRSDEDITEVRRSAMAPTKVSDGIDGVLEGVGVLQFNSAIGA